MHQHPLGGDIVDLEDINEQWFIFCFFSNYSDIAFPLEEKLLKNYQFKTYSKAVLHSSRPFDCIIHTPIKGIVIAVCKTLPWVQFAAL